MPGGRGRDPMSDHEFLGENLGGFELGGELGRPEDAEPVFLEEIDDAGGQCVVGADYGEVDLLLARKGE